MATAFFLSQPHGELDCETIVYQAPEGACLPGFCPNPGDFVMTTNQDGSGPYHCVPGAYLRPVLKGVEWPFSR